MMTRRITYVVYAKGDPSSIVGLITILPPHILCTLVEPPARFSPKKQWWGALQLASEERATLGSLRRSWKYMYDWWMYVVVFRAVSAGTERGKGNARDPSDKWRIRESSRSSGFWIFVSGPEPTKTDSTFFYIIMPAKDLTSLFFLPSSIQAHTTTITYYHRTFIMCC